MKISKLKGTRKDTGLCRLKIEGEMTIYQVAALHDKCLPFWRDFKEFELDLADVSDMDTAGIQLLLVFDRRSKASQKKVRLVSPSKPVADVLGIYRLGQRFELPT